jgi:ClpP class serine protease
MSRTSIAALIGASPLAISAEHGLPMLQMDLPKEAAQEVMAIETSAQVVTIERGQRFAIHRGVAYVPVRGILTPNSAMLEKYLGWSTYHGIVDTMAALTASDEVQATVMIFDTPGGSVLGIQGAVEAIRNAVAAKPVHALVHPLAASAGYWLASQCSDIAVTQGSWVGSVGTMTSGAQPLQPGMDGAQAFIQTSTHAGAKRPDLSSDHGKQLTQIRLDEMEAEFLGDVSRGRAIPAEDLSARMSRTDSNRDGGDVFWGDDALARGLVDSVETMAEFMGRIGGQYAPRSPSGPRPKSSAYGALAAAAQASANI